jgi:hypothetical protein
VVLNVTTKEVLTVCGSEERSLFGQAMRAPAFALPPNASTGVVRGDAGGQAAHHIFLRAPEGTRVREQRV